MRRLLCSAVALASLITISFAQTITQHFGNGANTFSIDFVEIGNPGNAADTTGSPNPVGSVAYTYNIGKYEVSRDIIIKADSAGSLGITMYDMISYGGNGVNRPATGISWNEAARFVNYLNTSKGYQAAYKFTSSGSNDYITLWEVGEYTGSNEFRHKDAYYFLPSIDEWYKAAYGAPNGTWYNYPTGSDSAPTAVSGGTTGAVYNRQSSPADITNAGAVSAYDTMAMGGNVLEWTESSNDGINNSPFKNRELRGGYWYSNADSLRESVPTSNVAGYEDYSTGFRVASVPEPSSVSLMALGAVVVVALGNIRKKH